MVESYIIAAHERDAMYQLQIADANPNGWNFISHTELQGSPVLFTSPLQAAIIEQAQLLAERMQSRTGIIVVEGKVMNDSYYGRGGIMAIDVYEAHGPLRDGLGHAGIGKSWLQDAGMR